MNNSGIDKPASVIQNKADGNKHDIEIHKAKPTAINLRKKKTTHSELVKCLVCSKEVDQLDTSLRRHCATDHCMTNLPKGNGGNQIKCTMCTFQTIDARHMASHLATLHPLVDKNVESAKQNMQLESRQIHSCHLCKFKTSYKRNGLYKHYAAVHFKDNIRADIEAHQKDSRYVNEGMDGENVESLTCPIAGCRTRLARKSAVILHCGTVHELVDKHLPIQHRLKRGALAHGKKFVERFVKKLGEGHDKKVGETTDNKVEGKPKMYVQLCSKPGTECVQSNNHSRQNVNETEDQASKQHDSDLNASVSPVAATCKEIIEIKLEPIFECETALVQVDGESDEIEIKNNIKEEHEHTAARSDDFIQNIKTENYDTEDPLHI